MVIPNDQTSADLVSLVRLNDSGGMYCGVPKRLFTIDEYLKYKLNYMIIITTIMITVKITTTILITIIIVM